jgi:hypothetical protein
VAHSVRNLRHLDADVQIIEPVIDVEIGIAKFDNEYY